MRCLSVKQPWAWAIVSGAKDVENRSWMPGARVMSVGDAFLIHASKAFDLKGYRWILENHAALGLAMDDIPARDEFALGAIVGAAIYGGSYEKDRPVGFFESSDCSPWFFGPRGWVIREALDLADPIPCRGALGLWDFDEHMCFELAGAEKNRAGMKPRPYKKGNDDE